MEFFPFFTFSLKKKQFFFYILLLVFFYLPVWDIIDTCLLILLLFINIIMLFLFLFVCFVFLTRNDKNCYVFIQLLLFFFRCCWFHLTYYFVSTLPAHQTFLCRCTCRRMHCSTFLNILDSHSLPQILKTKEKFHFTLTN